MKKIMLSCLFTIFVMGCSNDYSQESFPRIKSLANNNPDQAIEELRVFIYHNPEHPESKLLIGELLIAKPKVDEREMYLAQYYLKHAIEMGDKNLIAEAEVLILQAQLRRGLSPGDPISLVNLAKFAKENERYSRSAQLFVRASYEYLYTQEFTQARDRALDALEVSKKHLVDFNADPKDWAKEYEETLVLLTAIKMARGRVTEADKYLSLLKEIDDELAMVYEQLPSLALMNTVVKITDQVASQGILAWRPGFMQSDIADSQASENIVLKALAEAEDKNKDHVNDLRTLMSFHLWTSFKNTLDKSKYKQIANFIEENISFYENRM